MFRAVFFFIFVGLNLSASAGDLMLQRLNFIALPNSSDFIEFGVPRVQADTCLQVRLSFGWPTVVSEKFVEHLQFKEMDLNGKATDSLTLVNEPSMRMGEKIYSFPLHYKFAKEKFYGTHVHLNLANAKNFGEWLALFKPFGESVGLSSIVLLQTCPKKQE